MAPATTANVSAAEDESSERASERATPGTEGSEGLTPGLLTPNPLDEEGMGEENEETVHSVKSRVYRLSKGDEEGGPKWGVLGTGNCSLAHCAEQPVND